MLFYRRIAAAFDLHHLGQCAFCIRTSFKLAVFSLICLTIALLTGSQFVALAALCAAPLSLLWVSHIAAAAALDSKDDLDRGRRAFAQRFAKAVLGAAVLSAMPRLAHADSACGGYSENECTTTCEKVLSDGKCHFCHNCCTNPPGEQC